MFHFYWVSMQIENVCFNSQNMHKHIKNLRSDVLNTVNYYLGAVPKVPKLKIKNFSIKCIQLSRCDFMSMSSLHCLIMFHMKFYLR